MNHPREPCDRGHGSEAPTPITHIVDTLDVSGMEYGVIKLTERLDRRRFRPAICCLRRQAPLTRAWVAEDVPVTELRRGEGVSLPLVRRLAREFRRHRTRIAHSHNWPTFFYTVAASLLAPGVLVVHGEHGRERGSPSVKRTAASSLLARAAAHLTVVSKDLRKELIAAWGLPPDRVTYVPNGVDLRRFGLRSDGDAFRKEIGASPGTLVAVTIGRWSPVKNFPRIVEAFSRVIQDHPNALLAIVGGAPDAPEGKDLERLARRLGIASRVRLLGPRLDVPAVLAGADVYINASSYEGMSNTILEAMASRLPVVATSVGGTPYIVSDGDTGLLVPAEDTEALARSLRTLFLDPSLRQRLSARGREYVERSHSMEAMTRGYEAVYDTVVRRYLGAAPQAAALRPQASGSSGR